MPLPRCRACRVWWGCGIVWPLRIGVALRALGRRISVEPRNPLPWQDFSMARLRVRRRCKGLRHCPPHAPNSGVWRGRRGLSGLAQAFLYAGARGLLVSHWPVRDDAAAALTQAAVAARGRGVGQADALRRSMLDLMQKPGMAHPMVWAPFVVVGDGR